MSSGRKRLGFWEALFCLLALLGTVVLAGAIGGLAASTRPHEVPIAAVASQTNAELLARADLLAQQEMANWAFGTMVVGFLTMLGSFAALAFIRETLLATQETLKEAQDRNAIEMRAYVVVIPKGIEQSVGEWTFRGQIEIYNIGKTPAHNVSCKVRMKTSGYNEDQFQTQRFKNLAERTLLPDARMRQGTKNTGQNSDFQDRSGFIYVYGRVDYSDYLGERRSTMFCHRYNRSAFEGEINVVNLPLEPATLIRAEAARHHIHGNSAD